MKNLPNKIYLQIDANGETPKDFKDLAGITWCTERINDNDIEYVLVKDAPVFSLSSFDENDWAHMHDCLYDASGENLSTEELKKIFISLPHQLKSDAFVWGMSDTVWRESFYKWCKEKYKKSS